MKEYKASTNAGKGIIKRAEVFEGVSLRDVYGTYSADKERAWHRCMDMFMCTEEHNQFHICSHNSFQYSVAWYGKKDGENILRVETANNSMIVWLDR